MNINKKEIDRLLRLLDEDSYGIRTGQIIHDKKIDRSIIHKAKNMGYVRFYNEQLKEYTDVFNDSCFCRITGVGSQTINRYGGLEKIIEYDWWNRTLAIVAIAIAFCSLVAAVCSLIFQR
ncbi:MAG: hypothetical protein LBR26_13195 [Prevotella sp.]|jgi:hypothetical protein|nr:hypothetical protein [Prevotella sp.]